MNLMILLTFGSLSVVCYNVNKLGLGESWPAYCNHINTKIRYKAWKVRLYSIYKNITILHDDKNVQH